MAGQRMASIVPPPSVTSASLARVWSGDALASAPWGVALKRSPCVRVSARVRSEIASIPPSLRLSARRGRVGRSPSYDKWISTKISAFGASSAPSSALRPAWFYLRQGCRASSRALVSWAAAMRTWSPSGSKAALHCASMSSQSIMAHGKLFRVAAHGAIDADPQVITRKTLKPELDRGRRRVEGCAETRARGDRFERKGAEPPNRKSRAVNPAPVRVTRPARLGASRPRVRGLSLASGLDPGLSRRSRTHEAFGSGRAWRVALRFRRA